MTRASFLGGAETLPLSDGSALHLLSAMEVLQARAEAGRLAEEIAGEPALCANACILARSWRRRGKPLCQDGAALLERLSVPQVQDLARRWAEFERATNPGFHESEARIDALKKAWSTYPRSVLYGMCSAIFGRSRRKRASKR